MIPPASRLGVAVSGGADSVALLHILRELAPARGWTLAVLHLNHALRGPESERDAAFAASLAASLDLPAVIERRDLRAAPGNLEQACREARYDFFRRAMHSERLHRVAVGHTRTDQAETVLFRLLRGSGLTGLAGIRPVTRDGIVRPLIECDRPGIVAFLRARGIAWIEDSTNADLRFSRNRLRHELLPALRRDWNPAVDAALARLAALCLDEESYWDDEARRLLEPQPTPGEVVLDLRKLAGLPPAALRRLLRAAVARLPGDGRGLSFAHYEQLLDLAVRPQGSGRASLPGLLACRSFGFLRLTPDGPPRPAFSIPIAAPGSADLPWGGRLVLERETAGPDSRYNMNAETLDWDLVPAKLELRNWSPGIRYRPSGGSHDYSLRELFQRARIPVWERERWPLIGGAGGVIWARRFGPAEGFQASASSRSILRVREVNRNGCSGRL